MSDHLGNDGYGFLGDGAAGRTGDPDETTCDHLDDRGSTIMLVRDDRYGCAVCGERFRMVTEADYIASKSAPAWLSEALNSGDGTYRP